MPEWWLGLLLIAVFAVGRRSVRRASSRPAGCTRPASIRTALEGVLDTAWHLVLPVITLTLAYLAEYSLIMRSSLLDELGEDYLTTARAKGLRDVVVRRRHAVRNALLPTTTVSALNIGFIVVGRDHHRDGLLDPRARAALPEALSIPDYWVLQGTFLVASAGVIVANLLVNLLYGLLDPRVRT